MLGLPKKTELKKMLPKKAIYTKFHINTADKDKFDADVSKMYIVNEVSAATTAIAKGEKVQSFVVLLVELKRQGFNENNITFISKLIKQNILFILQFNDKSKLAIYRKKLMQTEWQKTDDLSVELKGLNLDNVWENIIIQVGGIRIGQGNSLDEQIVIDEKRQKLKKQIESLEKKARIEKQPRRKFEIVSRIKTLKSELEGY